jgi:2-keto-4-pentenoate hydratase/2-oxohepta-3-ene-1,7-dioic acid hydratase in catechol pathway
LKIARFNGGKIGVVRGDQIGDVTALCGADAAEWPPVGIVRIIADWQNLQPKIEAALSGMTFVPLTSVRLETPDPWPHNLLALPSNFKDHADEMAGRPYAISNSDNTGFFMKAPSSMVGPADAIVLPSGHAGREFHHECEVALIIGKRARNVPVEAAREYIFGYACLIDVTMRGLEERVMRKSFESFCPVGPWITTADEVGPTDDLNMRLWVNGELRQHSQPKHMLVGISEAVAMCSSVTTLEPGDIIASGTMAGVGPLKAGDEVTIEIDRVGKMTLPVV